MNTRPEIANRNTPTQSLLRRGGVYELAEIGPPLWRVFLDLPALVLLFVLLASLAGCRDFSDPVDDLEAARYAESISDVAEAEMHYERFLRKNPQSPERWNVWNRLLNISLNIRQEKAPAAAYLEIMLDEYSDNNDRRRVVELTLAGISNDLRNYDRAVSLWESLVNNEDTPSEDKAECLMNLSHAYLLQLQFEDATTALETCLKMDVTDSTKGRCLFDLAESQILQGDLSLAETSLLRLIGMEPEESEDVLARFILADVIEQRGRLNEALEHFKAIRSVYPNNKVIEMRIASLEKRKKKK